MIESLFGKFYPTKAVNQVYDLHQQWKLYSYDNNIKMCIP